VTPKDYHGAKVDDVFDTSTIKYLMLQLSLQLSRQVLMRFTLTVRLIAASTKGIAWPRQTVLVGGIVFCTWQPGYQLSLSTTKVE
jgi:hypothetical protein